MKNYTAVPKLMNEVGGWLGSTHTSGLKGVY
jgi:hypothetical protein